MIIETLVTWKLNIRDPDQNKSKNNLTPIPV